MSILFGIIGMSGVVLLWHARSLLAYSKITGIAILLRGLAMLIVSLLWFIFA